MVIDNKPIKQVHECKTLEVTVDKRLSWKSNTKTICRKITSGISDVHRILLIGNIFPFIMLLSAHISITAAKCGMCSMKHNLNDYNNSKIEH